MPDVVVDGRNLDAADGADHLLAALRLRHLTRQVADEAARLVRRVDETFDVRNALRLGEVGALDRVVGDREVDVRELRRDRGERRREQVAGRRDDIRALADRGRQVRQVVGVRVGLQRDRLDPELRLRLVQPGELILVEALVVELARVADKRRGERRLARACGPACGHGRDDQRYRKQRGNRQRCLSLHIPSLSVAHPRYCDERSTSGLAESSESRFVDEHPARLRSFIG
jgi:hypothetical protein